MDDRYILIGDKKPDTIWGKYCWDGSIIFQNERDKYYYISIGLFGLDAHIYGYGKSVIVMPETPEYEKLTELIKTKDNKVIEEYAQILAIKYLPPEYVYQMIEKIKEKKYNQGRRDTQSKLMEALGITQSDSTPYLMRQY